ncbi:hypothetical protein ACQP2F_07615 [Actinoplanes sp. CA-030573]|uniref:hypothetical protein n=1 Tax=Actinoplanes sp. CA-030573 TaxID=3239898 RepID=UPI003D8A8F76
MTGTDAPRPVRVAAWLTMALAPVGLLLLLDGFLELHWWGTTEERQLIALLAKIETDYGIEAPALLRGRDGAIQLVILGLLCIAYATLGLWIRRGRLWARTTALTTGVLLTLVGLFGVGADATESRPLSVYFDNLTGSAIPDRIAAVKALLYPGWYSWFEDIAQGLQVIASLAAVVAIAAAVITHSDYFSGGRSVDAPPDEWDAALGRVREQSRTHLEAES